MDRTVADQEERRLARGQRLQSIRRSLRLSRKAFAEKFGISIHTLQNWEIAKNGGLSEQRAFNLTALLKANHIYCSTEWLLYGTGPAPSLHDLNSNDAIDLPYSTLLTDSIQEDLELFYRRHPHRAVHMIITDDGHAPYYQVGDYVAGIRHFGSDFEKLIGEICIIHTQAGEQLVGQLKPGSLADRYHAVYLNPNTTLPKPIVYDLEISMVAPIIWALRVST